MATKLQSLLTPVPRHLDAQDVRAAFRRIAEARWGERMPLDPVRYARGVLTVRCPSPLWRTELLYSTEDVKDELARALPTLSLRRVSVVLA